MYYLSVSGITGERDELPHDVIENLRELKSHTHLPACVGFGIHRAQQVQSLKGIADGAIVGTAFVRRMQGHGNNAGLIAQHVADYCLDLRRG